MREISIPLITVPSPAGNLTDFVVKNAHEAPGTAQFSRRTETGWVDVSCAGFLAEVTALAKGLADSGVEPGDRVAVLSTTRYEWTLIDFAIWFAGAITVPIYETSAAEQVAWIMSDSRAVACFVETAEHAATLTQLRETTSALRAVWVIDEGAVDRLCAAGHAVDDEQIERRRSGLTGESVATLIYTSGTTGRPKGCELTHANFGDLALSAADHLGEVVRAADASTLLFLPLAHVFARFIQVLCVVSRAKMAHTSDVKNLLPDLAAVQPTFLLAVPRVFEKVYNSAESSAAASGRGKIFSWAAQTAIAYSTALDSGTGLGLVLRLRHALFDRLVYGRLRALFGGRVRFAVSGGAPLGSRLGHFYRGIGVTILEGWGLTESTAPACVNTPNEMRIGSVGKPLPGVSVATADDGELLVSGINVMRGYFNNPQATEESLRDGWLHTGDLGEIDDDGFVTITGRKKEIIVTANGKNVVPSMLEDRLRSHPLVSQCIVVGDQRPFVAALITLDAEMLGPWLSNHGKPAMDVVTAARDDDVRAEVQRAVDHANQVVSRAEAIRKFRLLDTDFTETGGQLTAKLSLKRAVVMKEFAALIEELYA